ncbi:hypothetical protein [Nocardioides ungokensis]
MGSVLVAALLGTVTVLAGATAADAADGPPTNTARPAITGVVAVGETVSADPGTWDPADVAYAYTWFVDGEQAGTGEQYTPTAADEGHALSVEIVASQPGGPDGTAASEPVTVLGAAPQNVEAPEVSGAFGVGGTLQVSDGTWDADGLTFTYQWMRGSVPIAGATGPSYSSTGEDCGQELSAVVTAHLAGHADGSAATSTVMVTCYCCRDEPVPTAVQIHTPQRVTTQDRARVRVRIMSAGSTEPQNGSISLRVARVRPAHTGTSRWLHMVHLHPEDHGRVTFRLPRLAAGKFSVRARYDRAPESQFMDSNNVETFKVVRAA